MEVKEVIPNRFYSRMTKVGIPKSLYFPNKFPDYEFGYTFGTHNSQIKTKILSLLETVVVNAEKLEDEAGACDGGLWSGLGGIAYMFLHLTRQPVLLTQAERLRFTLPIQQLLNRQLLYYNRTREAAKRQGDESQQVGFLVGDAGIYAVGAVLAKAIGNEELQLQCVTEFVNGSVVARTAEFHVNGAEELFYGRAGYLCAALWLDEALGYQPVPKDELFTIWKLIIEKGRDTAQRLHCTYPLAYTYCGSEYLGPAHGLSSILQVLLSWPQFMLEDPGAEKDIKSSLDFFQQVLFQGSTSANWAFPIFMDDVTQVPTRTQGHEFSQVGRSERESESRTRAEWSHGISGVIYLFAKAGLHYKNHSYLIGCVQCADFIWAHGLVKKGPGLCNGIAGNGYVFLLLYRLTEFDPKYLYQALRFAEFIFSKEFQDEAEIPEHPYSLFEGLAGTICFLSDVLRPATAQFPFFNIFYQPEFPDPPAAAPVGIPNNIPALLPISQSQPKPVVPLPPPLKPRPKLTPSPQMLQRATRPTTPRNHVHVRPTLQIQTQRTKKRKVQNTQSRKTSETSTNSYGSQSPNTKDNFCPTDLLEMEINVKDEPLDIDDRTSSD